MNCVQVLQLIRKCAVWAAVFAVVAGLGCRREPSSTPPAAVPPRPQVVASFFPLYDFARELAGPQADVHCLVPPGGDPHNAAGSPGIATRVARADLVLLLGLGMDGWVARLAAAEGHPRAVEIGTGLAHRKSGTPDIRDPEARETPGHDHSQDHDHGPLAGDPHIWLDPVLARELVQRIATELAAVLPEPRDELARRTAQVLARLDDLDREFRTGLANLPSRAVVTFHGAFGYLFERYGLEVAGVIEPFPGDEPSARHLRELVDRMRSRGLRVVFAEPQLPDRAAQVLAREIGGRVERLDPCETLLPERPAATYFERQRTNLATLQRALRPDPANP